MRRSPGQTKWCAMARIVGRGILTALLATLLALPACDPRQAGAPQRDAPGGPAGAQVAATRPSPPATAPAARTDLLAMGDWGEDTVEQREVAGAMSRYADSARKKGAHF